MRSLSDVLPRLRARVHLARDAGAFLAQRLRAQHRDDLETKPLKPLRAEDAAALLARRERASGEG